MRQLNTILLVDDDPATNFLNNFIITKSNMAKEVAVVENGLSAINYLSCVKEFFQRDQHCVPPDIIFLDINMPVMNGFEFLDAFKKLTSKQQLKSKIFVLTSSLHNRDKEKIATYSFVQGYYSKPLSEETLLSVVKKHFSN